jgi:hypothetical protein
MDSARDQMHYLIRASVAALAIALTLSFGTAEAISFPVASLPKSALYSMPDTTGIGHTITSQEIRGTPAPVSTVMRFVSCSGGIPKPIGPPVCGATPIANLVLKNHTMPLML